MIKCEHRYLHNTANRTLHKVATKCPSCSSCPSCSMTSGLPRCQTGGRSSTCAAVAPMYTVHRGSCRAPPDMVPLTHPTTVAPTFCGCIIRAFLGSQHMRLSSSEYIFGPEPSRLCQFVSRIIVAMLASEVAAVHHLPGMPPRAAPLIQADSRQTS